MLSACEESKFSFCCSSGGGGSLLFSIADGTGLERRSSFPFAKLLLSAGTFNVFGLDGFDAEADGFVLTGIVDSFGLLKIA